MLDFACIPSSPVSYDEVQVHYHELQIKQEETVIFGCKETKITSDCDPSVFFKAPETTLVCPTDVFPLQKAPEPSPQCFVSHALQLSTQTLKEALLTDNITITAQIPLASDAFGEGIAHDFFSSLKMSFDFSQSPLLTSHDFGYSRISKKEEKKQSWHPIVADSGSEGIKLEIEEDLLPKQFFVVIRLQAKREYLRVLEISGIGKEYQLPIFHELKTLKSMKRCAKYRPTEDTLSNPEETTTSNGARHQVVKGYVSRLTLGQMALILGLQEYRVALVKDIETAVVSMLDQLCGFRIGETTWCRGTPRIERQKMINRVFEYSKIYFPSFSRNIIQIIIKRGAYTRKQESLRRRRRQKMKGL